MSDSRYELPKRGHQDGASYLDPDQTPGEDMLVDRNVGDLLDEGYSPPERAVDYDRWSNEHETIDERLTEEEPDPYTRLTFGDDSDDSNDSDSQDPADDGDEALDVDGYGDAEGSGVRAGRLVAPDEGAGEDTEKTAIGRDVGIDGGAASAEEAAMHIEGDR